MRKANDEHVLLRKLSCAAVILAVYLLGRCIPLYGIDQAWYAQLSQGADFFLGLVVGGDAYRASVLALGISPYMVASILMMAVTTVRKAVSRSRFSQGKMEKALYVLAFILAVFQAGLAAYGMKFNPSPLPLNALRGIAAAEMVAGAMFIVYLAEMNKEHGIGGQSLLILTNLVSSILSMVTGHSLQVLAVPLACTAVTVLITLVMENAEFRMPVQRIFIYNIYHDKNYVAIKYNPAGVMPAMFSTAIFTFLTLGVRLLTYIWPESPGLAHALESMSLQQPAGIAVYIAVVYLLSIGLALAMLSPSEMTRQMMRENDSICNVCAGRPTKTYLTWVILCISILSATVMSACVGTALLLQLGGLVTDGLVMLPSVAMMLTSILVNLTRELRTAISFESYRVFL